MMHRQTVEKFKRRALRIAKEGFRKIPTRNDAIVVSSFGRAGSTLVYDAIVRGMAEARFGAASSLTKRLVRDDTFDTVPRYFCPGVVYKTHDYPHILKNSERVRAVFLFGSAIEAALSAHDQKSLRGEEWMKLHFKHLQRPYSHSSLLTDDALGFRDQCMSWMSFEDKPVLCMRYEGLWDNVRTLSQFCGFEVSLPTREARAPKVFSEKNMDAARRTYTDLDRATDNLPDCFLADPRYGNILSKIN